MVSFFAVSSAVGLIFSILFFSPQSLGQHFHQFFLLLLQGACRIKGDGTGHLENMPPVIHMDRIENQCFSRGTIIHGGNVQKARIDPAMMGLKARRLLGENDQVLTAFQPPQALAHGGQNPAIMVHGHSGRKAQNGWQDGRPPDKAGSHYTTVQKKNRAATSNPAAHTRAPAWGPASVHSSRCGNAPAGETWYTCRRAKGPRMVAHKDRWLPPEGFLPLRGHGRRYGAHKGAQPLIGF